MYILHTLSTLKEVCRNKICIIGKLFKILVQHMVKTEKMRAKGRTLLIKLPKRYIYIYIRLPKQP